MDVAGVKVESAPVELLTSVGSCVAVCLRDPVLKCGGLAQMMLSHSANGLREPLPSKYADDAFKKSQLQIRVNFCNRLTDGGYLIMGKSEIPTGVALDFRTFSFWF